MDIIASRVLGYTVYQATRSVLSCFLYIIREVVVVRDGLLLFILD